MLEKKKKKQLVVPAHKILAALLKHLLVGMYDREQVTGSRLKDLSLTFYGLYRFPRRSPRASFRVKHQQSFIKLLGTGAGVEVGGVHFNFTGEYQT